MHRVVKPVGKLAVAKIASDAMPIVAYDKDRLDGAKVKVFNGEMTLRDILHFSSPRENLSDEMKEWKYSNLPNIHRGLDKIAKAIEWGIPTFFGLLWAKKFVSGGDVVDYELISTQVVTDEFVGHVVDAMQDITGAPGNLIDDYKWHGIGTGPAGSPAAGDSALVAELTTDYSPDSKRDDNDAGTSTEGATANIYKTVGTNTPDGAVAIVEHGVFTHVDVGDASELLLDRSGFSTINLNGTGDALQTTYELTLSSGG